MEMKMTKRKIVFNEVDRDWVMFQLIDGNYFMLENIYYRQANVHEEDEYNFELLDPSHMIDAPLSSFIDMRFWLKEEI